MHRKSQLNYAIAVSACLLMTTVACTPDTPAAPTPATPPVSSNATKVSAPTLVSPNDGESLNVLTPTMRVNEATGQFVSKPFSYEFELQNSGGTPIASSTVNSTSLTVTTSPDGHG